MVTFQTYISQFYLIRLIIVLRRSGFEGARLSFIFPLEFKDAFFHYYVVSHSDLSGPFYIVQPGLYKLVWLVVYPRPSSIIFRYYQLAEYLSYVLKSCCACIEDIHALFMSYKSIIGDEFTVFVLLCQIKIETFHYNDV
jgi:hypothetical protein